MQIYYVYKVLLCVLFKLSAIRCVPKFCAHYLEVDHVEDFYGDALHALGYASYQYHVYTLYILILY